MLNVASFRKKTRTYFQFSTFSVTCRQHKLCASGVKIRSNTYTCGSREQARTGKTTKHSRSYWKLAQHRRELLSQAAQQASSSLKLEFSDLYRLNWRLLQRLGGGTILSFYYGNSATLAVLTEFPEHAWEVWRFSKAPQNWWKIASKGLEAQDPVVCTVMREFVQYAQSPDATQLWYPLGVLGSLEYIQNKLYSQERSQSAKSNEQSDDVDSGSSSPTNLWLQSEYRYKFVMDLVGNEPLEKLYGIDISTFLSKGAAAFLDMHSFSAAKAIYCEIPDHHWKVWKFSRLPRNWWKQLSYNFLAGDPVSEAIVRLYIDDVASEHNIKSLSDWRNFNVNRLPAAEIARLNMLGRLPTILQRLYLVEKVAKPNKRRVEQGQLSRLLGKLLPANGLDVHKRITNS